jgi:hypothetical protein
LLYASENGDRWFLVRQPNPDRVFVLHEPNAPSGGRGSMIDVGEFLVRGGSGPEKLALLHLIGTLVDERLPPNAIAPDEATMPIAFI